MQLQPRRQPGRIDRKAAAYASEIRRLRDAGYTYEAIREALADIGIQLSTSALRREVRRSRSQPHLITAPSPSALARAIAPPPSPVQPQACVAGPAGLSSRDIAEAYFEANPSNALRTSKGTS